MKSYLELLQKCLLEGDHREDRTGVGTYSLFGEHLRFDLSQGFPLITSKRVHFKSVVHELLWMLRGETNIKSLTDEGVTIWNEWANEAGSLGPVYGAQWRSWWDDTGYAHDQIKKVQTTLICDPTSRRMVVCAWNVGDLDSMALAPCHCLFQFYVANDRLSCHLYQRSADIFLGVPFNIASYALLTHLMAKTTGYEVGELHISFGDVHLYTNHVEQATEQLRRTPANLPRLWIEGTKDNVWEYEYEQISLEGYYPHPAIPAPVAV